jgi:DivIVA domain-containing protein
VVQRHFRRVRKGYDPAEVDRHLELVSEWFRTSRTAEKAREVERQLLAREHAMTEKEAQADRLLENSRREAEATLEGARLRAEADRRAAETLRQDAEMAVGQRL